jgi:hypothetical protein
MESVSVEHSILTVTVLLEDQSEQVHVESEGRAEQGGQGHCDHEEGGQVKKICRYCGVELKSNGYQLVDGDYNIYCHKSNTSPYLHNEVVGETVKPFGKLYAIKEVKELGQVTMSPTTPNNYTVTAKGLGLKEAKELVEKIMRLGVREFLSNPSNFIACNGDPITKI